MSHTQKNLDSEPLLREESSMNTEPSGRSSAESFPRSSTASTTSLVLEHLHGDGLVQKPLSPYRDDVDDFEPLERKFEHLDVEEATLNPGRPADQKYRRWFLVLGTVCAAGWLAALGLFIYNGYYLHRSNFEHDPDATAVFGNGKKITIDQLQRGAWRPASRHIEWIAGPEGQDGLLLEEAPGHGKDYLIVEDIRRLVGETVQKNTTTLMKKGGFDVGSETIVPQRVSVSPDFKTVLVMSDRKHNWRHSYTGRYWLFDVESQQGRPLDPDDPDGRIQLATWSPDSDAVVFTRDNEMFLRRLTSRDVTRITTNGGPQMFNGVPDWVYEEEVFSGNSATWWSGDGRYVAFLATNETRVLEYPVQYFISRPSGIHPPPELENYPETRKIKYPKAGTPNPVVHLRFYDMDRGEVFDVPIEDDFPDDTRLITEVIWAGKSGRVLIRETNRDSNVLKMVLVDVERREGRIVRTKDVDKLDGGWFEITETTIFVPADPNNGRPTDGYIDTVIHEGYDHLGYFRSMGDAEPLMLTSGKWEVENAPSAIDLKNNLVYFVSTKESSIQRHVYRVGLDGTGLEALTDTSNEGYYGVSFSKGAGFALLNYAGPKVPWQKVISTPSNSEEFEYTIEDNKDLGQMAASHELPMKRYSTVTIDGVELNVVERLPPHFREHKRYPVLFFLYGGPGSQQVDKKFAVDFQSYVAATLGYLVVTVDGRGTGFLGRSVRCVIRGNLGYYEARDQIETAKIWAKKSYVDADRMAIWGWSYGGYMTLKTLEQDAGETFSYGMAVAPVTDWGFYDTIYTERWMGTPQDNPDGYQNASVSNVTAIAQSTRFLIMHGVSDDNVHFQNTLTLLDKFDLAGVENYDVHVFPDSDHSIYFHNANKIVYDKLSWWLTNAFNGEWHRIKNPVPLRAGAQIGQVVRRQIEELHNHT